MAKQVSMSTVKMDVPAVTTAPEFSVMEDGKVVGDLRVSKGGAFWRPKNAQQYLHLSWEQLDEIFKAKGEPRTVGEYNIKPSPPISFEEF
jgi:hypothetical protein